VLAQAVFGELVQRALVEWPVGMDLLPVDLQEWVSHHDLLSVIATCIEIP
jgi:hypothetical protein